MVYFRLRSAQSRALVTLLSIPKRKPCSNGNVLGPWMKKSCFSSLTWPCLAAKTSLRVLRQLREHPNILTGLDEQNPVQRVMEDPRASILASAVSRLSLSSNGVADAKDSALPKPVMGALSVGDNKALYTVVTGAVARKLVTLIQTTAEQITAQTKLADICMDSMLAVEVRREATPGIDVPLLEFMATKATVGKIGRRVAEGLLERFKKGKGRRYIV